MCLPHYRGHNNISKNRVLYQLYIVIQYVFLHTVATNPGVLVYLYNCAKTGTKLKVAVEFETVVWASWQTEPKGISGWSLTVSYLCRNRSTVPRAVASPPQTAGIRNRRGLCARGFAVENGNNLISRCFREKAVIGASLASQHSQRF